MRRIGGQRRAVRQLRRTLRSRLVAPLSFGLAGRVEQASPRRQTDAHHAASTRAADRSSVHRAARTITGRIATQSVGVADRRTADLAGVVQVAGAGPIGVAASVVTCIADTGLAHQHSGGRQAGCVERRFLVSLIGRHRSTVGELRLARVGRLFTPAARSAVRIAIAATGWLAVAVDAARHRSTYQPTVYLGAGTVAVRIATVQVRIADSRSADRARGGRRAWTVAIGKAALAIGQVADRRATDDCLVCRRAGSRAVGKAALEVGIADSRSADRGRGGRRAGAHVVGKAALEIGITDSRSADGATIRSGARTIAIGVTALEVGITDSRSADRASVGGGAGTDAIGVSALVVLGVTHSALTDQQGGSSGAGAVQRRIHVRRVRGDRGSVRELRRTHVRGDVAPVATCAVPIDVAAGRRSAGQGDAASQRTTDRASIERRARTIAHCVATLEIVGIADERATNGGLGGHGAGTIAVCITTLEVGIADTRSTDRGLGRRSARTIAVRESALEVWITDLGAANRRRAGRCAGTHCVRIAALEIRITDLRTTDRTGSGRGARTVAVCIAALQVGVTDQRTTNRSSVGRSTWTVAVCIAALQVGITDARTTDNGLIRDGAGATVVHVAALVVAVADAALADQGGSSGIAQTVEDRGRSQVAGIRWHRDAVGDLRQTLLERDVAPVAALAVCIFRAAHRGENLGAVQRLRFLGGLDVVVGCDHRARGTTVDVDGDVHRAACAGVQGAGQRTGHNTRGSDHRRRTGHTRWRSEGLVRRVP